MLGFLKVHEDAQLPKYAHANDSGMDVHSVGEDFTIEPFKRVLTATGLKVVIPEGYEIQVRSKSGLSLNEGLIVLNAPATIDEGYTGELGVILYNVSDEPIKIKKGQKIAQLVLAPVARPVDNRVYELTQDEFKELTEKYTRGTGGFGSTGVNK